MMKTYSVHFQFLTVDAAKAAQEETEGSELNPENAQDQTWVILRNITPDEAFAFHERHGCEMVVKRRPKGFYGEPRPNTDLLV